LVMFKGCRARLPAAPTHDDGLSVREGFSNARAHVRQRSCVGFGPHFYLGNPASCTYRDSHARRR
jgi:hypothetical protein